MQHLTVVFVTAQHNVLKSSLPMPESNDELLIENNYLQESDKLCDAISELLRIRLNENQLQSIRHQKALRLRTETCRPALMKTIWKQIDSEPLVSRK